MTSAIFGIMSASRQERSKLTDYYAKYSPHLDVRDVGAWTVGATACDATCKAIEEGPNSIRGIASELSTTSAFLEMKECEDPSQYASILKANCFVLHPESGALSLVRHESGYLPLYWAFRAGTFAFGSSLLAFRCLGWTQPDPVGVTSFLRSGHTIGKRTLLTGVDALEPGHVLRARPLTDSFETTDQSRLWSELDWKTSPSEALDSLWARLLTAVSCSVPDQGELALMMSGGWDSRTLLAAMLELGHTPRLYVHGNVESREIELVRRLAAACDLKAIVEPIDEQCLDPDWLSSRLPTAENVVFPHWHRAGEVLRGHGIETVAAGTYGEVLGGHYGPAMLKKGSGKAFTVARELLGLVPHKQGISGPEEEDLHRLVNLLRPPLTLRPYYYAEEWWKSQSDISSELQADALEVLMGYVSRGVKSSALLVEAFVTEHRGAQYIAAQPLSLMNDVTAVQPFADSGLLRLASRIPHERRVHNLLNRRMLRRAAPQLAEYPMAATLVPAKWPVAAQELSRLARSTTEKLESMVGDRINFRSPRAWSWVDFSFVKMPGAIEPLLADLRLPIWNRMTLQRTLNRVRGGGVSAHGFYDQLMKIATVDLLLRDN